MKHFSKSFGLCQVINVTESSKNDFIFELNCWILKALFNPTKF